MIVPSPLVPSPKEDSYAWQSNPVATLFNGAGMWSPNRLFRLRPALTILCLHILLLGWRANPC
jgi:hypothetical protein